MGNRGRESTVQTGEQLLKARERIYGNSCWPTPQQELLLKASLWRGRGAVEAWEAWIASGVDLDGIDPGSYRLIPLVYRMLKREGIHHPLMPKLKGIYRNTWYRNQLFLHRLNSVLYTFHQAGIQTMVLKGAALLVLYYRDFGLRPMQDIDVLVHPRQALAAAALLRQSGWKPQYAHPIEDLMASYLHGEEFTDPDRRGENLDFHWHIFQHCLQTDVDEALWAGSVPLKVGDVWTRALNPTDQILHTASHGCQPGSATGPIRWLADTTLILESTNGAVHWQHLLHQSQKWGFVLPLRETLFYVQDRLRIPIPTTVLDRLRKMRVTLKERVLYESSHPSPRTLPESLLLHWYWYSKRVIAKNVFQKLIGFPGFLMWLLNLKHFWELPPRLLSKLLRRSVRSLQWRKAEL